MYSPTLRLLTVLELLESHSHLSGAQIAERLEIDPRTVRRYITMLQDMGIPVEAERGPHGAYHLERGRRLPPLLYSDAEAVALSLGLLAIRELRFPVNVAAVEGALAKTERVLPENVLHQVRSMQEAITFNAETYGYLPPSMPHHEFVVTLSAAIARHERVRIAYRAWQGDQTERDFDPYGIVYNEGYWYTAGYCHLRQDIRTFRLDRIDALNPRPERFERPESFDTLSYVLRSIATAQGTHSVELILQTTLEHAQDAIKPLKGQVCASDEGVLFRAEFSELGWLAYFLLMLDFPVIVRAPQALKAMMQRIAARAAQMAGPPEDQPPML